MDKIFLLPIGDIPIKKPRPSLAYDLISSWSNDPTRPQMGRISAAAIGICGQINHWPKYDTDQARPIAYGGKMMDILIGAGCKPALILEAGVDILQWIAPMLINDDELKKKGDGSPPPSPDGSKE